MSVTSVPVFSLNRDLRAVSSDVDLLDASDWFARATKQIPDMANGGSRNRARRGMSWWLRFRPDDGYLERGVRVSKNHETGHLRFESG